MPSWQRHGLRHARRAVQPPAARWVSLVGIRQRQDAIDAAGGAPLANPISFLTPALDILSSNLNILPATGGAVEDLQHPDVDEIDDILINRDAGDVTAFAETPTPTLAGLYRPTPPLLRTENHLFRYFIDGSLRTYYLATGLEGVRSFPIQLAQIGAAVITRAEDGRVSVLHQRQRILLLIPTGSRGISDTVWKQIEKLKTLDGLFEPIDVTTPDAISGPESDAIDLRNKGGGKARHQMHLLEIGLIEATDGRRDASNWLIIDGAVKLGDFIRSPYMIGVAKSFSKTPRFYFGRGRQQSRDVTAILAGLPHAHRTAAFSAYDGQVAFWYVRLREQKELDYPLMGVVKVELPLPDRQPVDADLANLLSRALVAERNVTPYGLDRRWHCHLYPIYLAERAIKNRFYSQDVLMGAIRWPRSISLTQSQEV
jgi:hypothetical protein